MTYNPKQYWNRRKFNVMEFQNLSERDYMVKTLKNLKPDDMLEIGPGSGRVYKTLFAESIIAPQTYMAVDISESLIDLHEQNTKYRPKLWDGITLPFDDGEFDICLSFNVTLHVSTANIKHHLEEMLRVAKYVYVATHEGPEVDPTEHCFWHYHDDLFKELGGKIISKEWFPNQRVHYLVEKI